MTDDASTPTVGFDYRRVMKDDNLEIGKDL